MTGGKNAAAQEYAERYPQIVRLCRVASGKSSGCALNLGMSLATGRHVAFVNGADMLAHDFLANGIAASASPTLPGQHILQKLLKALAQNAPVKHFSPANADFEAFALTPPPPHFVGFDGMENAVNLSIIVVANRHCAALVPCLQWLLQAAQTIPDIEILLFVSASPAPHLPSSPCLRIRHIPQSCPEGYLRNCALDAAKGRYVIFIDPRREVNADFIDVAAMTDFASDLVFLGCEVEKDGFAEYSGPNTGALSLGEALSWLLENDLGHYGKIYNLSFLRAQNLRFAESLEGSDSAFAASAILRARAIAALNVSACLFYADAEACRTAVAEARAIAALWQALQNYPSEYLEPVRNKLDGQLEQWLLPACRDDAAVQIAAKACMDSSPGT